MHLKCLVLSLQGFCEVGTAPAALILLLSRLCLDFQESTIVYLVKNNTINPLRPSIKLQILLLCFHTFITDVKGRSCSNINRISFE